MFIRYRLYEFEVEKRLKLKGEKQFHGLSLIVFSNLHYAKCIIGSLKGVRTCEVVHEDIHTKDSVMYFILNNLELNVS